MTADYRALLLELVETWDSFSYADAGDATDRMNEAVEEARAALAEPEPPADAGKVETLRELALKELDAWVEERNGLGESIICDGLRVRLIKAALAEPEPPVDGEVAELVAELKLMASDAAAASHTSDAKILTRAADLLERLAKPEPVGPTDTQVENLADDLGISKGYADHETGFYVAVPDLGPLARAVLARWGRQPASDAPASCPPGG